MKRLTEILFLAGLIGMGSIRSVAAGKQETLPAGVEQIIPRGQIANLLNRHEVVNDQNGETAFAAVW
jgi:hypothetical protein